MAQPTVQLFVNPAAGSSSRKRVAALAQAFEAAGARVILSHDQRDDAAIDGSATHVCAVGGDGTLRHVAAAAGRAGRPLILAVYPAGTVNLIARECGYGRNPAAFVRRVLANAPPRTHHAGRIGEIPLFSCASVGPDSLAVAGLSPRLKRLIGRAAYAVAFAKLLIRWPRPRLRIAHDGRETVCEAVYIAKGRYFAGPWSFAPDASVDQPLLHVVALGRARRRDYARFLWALWRRKNLTGRAGISCFTCTELTIDGAGALPLQADGDIVAHLPARLALASETLSFA